MDIIEYLNSFTLKNNKGKSFKSTIKLNPLPENCYKCPFFYTPNSDGKGYAWLAYKTCFLITIEDSIEDRAGILFKRHKDCPLSKE